MKMFDFIGINSFLNKTKTKLKIMIHKQDKIKENWLI